MNRTNKKQNMMSQTKAKKVTVQGADPPVPVGVGGDGTGHSRPSSSDSLDPPVAYQAGVINRATGGTGHSDGGPREDKNRCTKETRRVSSGPNMVTIDLRQEEVISEKIPRHSRLNVISQLRRCNSFDTGKKRKVMDTSIDANAGCEDTIRRSEDPIAFVIREAIMMVINCTQDLDKRVAENSNTKREIKETVNKLKRSVEVLHRDSTTAWLEKHKWTEVQTPTYDVECQTEEKGNVGVMDTQMSEAWGPSIRYKDTADKITQTPRDPWRSRKENSVEGIREDISGNRGFEGL